MLQNNSTWDIFIEQIVPEMGSTLWMLLVVTLLSLVLGGLIAIAMIFTKSNGLHPCKYIFGLLEGLVDVLISMPFIVLAVALIPLTRMLVGTSIGQVAALVPLTFVTMSTLAKLIYNGLLEVNIWVVEAAKSFGASNLQILFIMLKESLPVIISGTTLSTVTTLGSIAMMGSLGAGGIGFVAIAIGYKRNNPTAVWIIVIILIIFTQLINYLGVLLYEKWR